MTRRLKRRLAFWQVPGNQIDDHAPDEHRPLSPDVDVALAELPFVFVRGRVDHTVPVPEHLHDHLLLACVAVFTPADVERGLAIDGSKPVKGVGQSDLPPPVDGDVHRDVSDGANELPDSDGKLVAAAGEARSEEHTS